MIDSVSEIAARLRGEHDDAASRGGRTVYLTLDDLRAILDENERLTAALAVRESTHVVARPGEEYHEDMGNMLWWRFPIVEPPYAGIPGDSDWPGYHTHWTPLIVPNTPAVEVAAEPA